MIDWLIVCIDVCMRKLAYEVEVLLPGLSSLLLPCYLPGSQLRLLGLEQVPSPTAVMSVGDSVLCSTPAGLVHPCNRFLISSFAWRPNKWLTYMTASFLDISLTWSVGKILQTHSQVQTCGL